MSDQTQLRLAASIDILQALASGEDPARSAMPNLVDRANELVTARDVALAEATAEIERLRAQVSMLDRQLARHVAKGETRLAKALADVAAVPFEIDTLDLNGFYVYFLWGHGGELLYIGKSTNLLSRIGSHMGNSVRRPLVARITLIKCADTASLARTEERLIREYRPPLNIAGVA